MSEPNLLTSTAEIVAAHPSKSKVGAGALPALIASVHGALGMGHLAWCGMVLIGVVGALPALAQQTRYSVYCANGHIEVDMRAQSQMESARGGDVCAFGRFTSLSSAQDLADKQFHGIGAGCTCGR